MSNSATKRECFKRGLFGLPSTEIKFVEQIKAGVILFLFEYEKRQLHGVFRASCDGGINIVPNAFASLGMQFPAQVKFIPIWFCKPLPEKSFRDAIRENYFSANKFNFGLSENQVRKLLDLFSKRMLEPEVPWSPLTRKEDLKSERYTSGKAGRSVNHGMCTGSVPNEQGVGGNVSPIRMHKCQGDSLRYDGEVEYLGLNANKQGRAAQLTVDTTSGYVTDHIALRNESRFTAQNEDYMDICLRPNIIGGYSSRSPSDNIRVHGDGRLSVSGKFLSEDLRKTDKRRIFTDDITREDLQKTDQRMIFSDDIMREDIRRTDQRMIFSDDIMREDLRKTDQRMIFSDDIVSDRFMSEDLRKTDQRMAFSDDICGLHNSNVSSSVFYRNPPNSEYNSLVQNQLRPTSSVIHSIQAQILNNSCATQGDGSSKSTNVLYDLDVPGLNFSRPSSVGINNDAKSMMVGNSFLNNTGRNSLNCQPCIIHPELEDTNRWNNVGGFSNFVLYSSNMDFIPLNAAQNSDHFAADSVLYETCNIPKCSSNPIPPSDIGNSGRVHEPFSSFFQNHQSRLSNDVHSTTLLENLSNEITLQKDTEAFVPDVQWPSDGLSPDGDPLIQQYDIGCYKDSQNSKFDYAQKKSSVFSRLSFIQDVNKQKNGSNARKGEYDFQTSVDEVMESVRQSHNQWIKKRKPKHSKAESLRDKSQIISTRMKGDCLETTLTDLSMDLTTSSGCNTKETAVEGCFVDFKRRSKVRKGATENEIRSSNESDKGGDSGLVQQKRRKLIRPNFSKSITSDDKGINFGASQNFQAPVSNESCTVEDVSESCHALVQTQDKVGAGVQNIIGQIHSEDKSSAHGREYACSGGGKKATDGVPTSLNDKSKLQNAIGQTHSEDKNGSHARRGVRIKREEKATDGAPASEDKNGSPARRGVCIEGGEKATDSAPASEDKNDSPARRGVCVNGGEKTFDGDVAPTLNDESKCLENTKNQNVFSSTSCKDKSCHIKKGLCVMDGAPGFEDKNGSHARRGVCIKRGEKAIDGAPALNDESKCLENTKNQNVFSSASCKDESCHIKKKGVCVMNSVKSVSLGTESSHLIRQGHRAENKIISPVRGTNNEEERPRNCSSSISFKNKDGSGYLKNSGNEKDPIETACPIKKGLGAMDSTGTGLNCQEHYTGKIICACIGSNTEGGKSKGSGSFNAEVKVGFDCLQNSHNKNASVATSCFKEGVIASTKLATPESKSLHSINQECRVYKVICAGRAIKGEEGMSKDGSYPFATEVEDDGSESSCNRNPQ
ncbi:hypothetical protein RJT34_02512 [Clitoria ternatea]|uniref:DCD domain-containing protein n=1 Tax=Clitoria ternatea TaxID=43366 RepID=A0AAN9KKL5_CLITE